MTTSASAIPQNNIALTDGMHIHLIGIGGAGISAIARVLLQRGFIVSGSDMNGNAFTEALSVQGATIFIGHSAHQIGGAQLVVRSSAIPESNPEVMAARQTDIPVLKRSDFLGYLMAGQVGVAIAGTHGKTTTTSLVAHILLEAGLDPTVIVGGVLPTLGSNAHAGSGEHFVIEADEYDNMFLGLRPTVAVINNVEHDHPDIFDSAETYRSAFTAFAQLLPQGGHLIANADDAEVMALVDALDSGATVSTFGIDSISDYRAENIRPNQLGGSDFVVTGRTELVGLARVRIPGEHNVRNVLAAIATAQALGVDFDAIQQALATFGGVGRRFQVIGTAGSVTIIDDYAHHPTEIKVTLAAARQQFPGRTIWAVWQPHTYSRTKLLFDEFVGSFEGADKMIALDIYASRERDTLGVDSGQVIAAIKKTGHAYAEHIGRIEDAATYLLDRIRPNDVLLTLGAGDGNLVGQKVLAGLEERR